jgi:GrpB-like predicted nucleotidyltransferase (UPF0157 family)/GTPase SAR1 family protein
LSYQDKHGHSMCSVFEKESGAFIGQAGLFHIGFFDKQPEIEIGYRLYKKYWGKGYGTEVAKALINWGFKHLPVSKIVAFVHPDNTASQQILKKSGMINLGIQNCYYGNLVKYEIYKDDSIELIPYRAEWLNMAEEEIKRLQDILPTQHILDVQHVGSTAIPDIQGKPIIDIQIAVDSLIAMKPIAITTLKNLGYEYWSDNPDTERMFFVKGMPPFGDKRTHHVHIVEPASRHWQEKIQFRDYLLSHPEVAREYEGLKLQLANQHVYDREKYTDAKTQFINNVLKKASITSLNKKVPFVIFLTGASGAGKTTLVNAFSHQSHDQSIVCLHFDSIGVPSVEEMISVYGSPSEWQKAMMYHWAQKIIRDYQNKSLLIIEGQVNLDYIVYAFAGFNIHPYKIILVHCNNATRHHRLHLDRNQPELINDDMDKWAEFLKKQALEKNVTILDTSIMNTNEMIDVFKEYITKVKCNE